MQRPRQRPSRDAVTVPSADRIQLLAVIAARDEEHLGGQRQRQDRSDPAGELGAIGLGHGDAVAVDELLDELQGRRRKRLGPGEVADERCVVADRVDQSNPVSARTRRDVGRERRQVPQSRDVGDDGEDGRLDVGDHLLEQRELERLTNDDRGVIGIDERGGGEAHAGALGDEAPIQVGVDRHRAGTQQPAELRTAADVQEDARGAVGHRDGVERHGVVDPHHQAS